MRIYALALALLLTGCAAKTRLKQYQTFEFRGITVTAEGRHICYRPEVRFDAKTGKQYVQCMENK